MSFCIIDALVSMRLSISIADFAKLCAWHIWLCNADATIIQYLSFLWPSFVPLHVDFCLHTKATWTHCLHALVGSSVTCGIEGAVCNWWWRGACSNGCCNYKKAPDPGLGFRPGRENGWDGRADKEEIGKKTEPPEKPHEWCHIWQFGILMEYM